MLAGIVISLLGIMVCGWAGALREKAKGDDNKTGGNLKLGLIFATMAGVLSAVSNYALLAGEPLEQAAVDQGASVLLKMNAIYPFANGGAWVTNVIGCSFLLVRNRRAGQFVKLPGGGRGKLSFYWLMAALRVTPATARAVPNANAARTEPVPQATVSPPRLSITFGETHDSEFRAPGAFPVTGP